MGLAMTQSYFTLMKDCDDTASIIIAGPVSLEALFTHQLAYLEGKCSIALVIYTEGFPCCDTNGIRTKNTWRNSTYGGSVIVQE